MASRSHPHHSAMPGSASGAPCSPDYELSAAERILLEAACRQSDLIADLEAQVDLDGLMIRGTTGQSAPEGDRLRPVTIFRDEQAEDLDFFAGMSAA